MFNQWKSSLEFWESKNSFPLFPGKTKQGKTKQSNQTIEEIVCGEEKKSEKGKISGWTPFRRHDKYEARSRIIGGVVSGTFLERQASTSYMVIFMYRYCSSLKQRLKKTVDVYFLCRLMYLLWPALAIAQSIPSGPISPGHLSGFCHFCSEDLQMPQSGAGRFKKKKHTHTQRLKKVCKCPPQDNTKTSFSCK